MRISCPSCQSSYKIADEKVQGRTVKVRCRKCGLTIHVNEQGVMSEAAAAGSPADAGGGGGDAQFSVLVAEGDQRDMGLADIVAAYNSGVITGDTFVWSEGQPDWMPLGEVPTIIDAISAASEAVDKAATGQPAAAPAPMVTATPAPVATATPAPVAAAPAPVVPAPEPVAPAPAPSLFGAAPAPAAATPAPLFGPGPTAAVQTSYEKKPDLFSTQAMAGSDDDVATSAPHVSPAMSSKPTGARDESSVLFSLSALTSAAASTSSSSDPNTGGDDSGLIDLRALAEKDAGAPQPAFAAPVGGILDAAPLLGTPIMDPNLNQLKASDPPPSKSNTPIIIGIAIGAVGILSAVVAVVVVLTREPPPPAPLPIPTATEVAAPTVPVPMPTDTSSSAAAAPPTGAASATAPTTTARPTGPRTGPAKPGGTTGASTKPESTGGSTEPAPTKKPPANKCNCPPGDLACNMACAVK
jgi:predicted Zn finger-like uncharacterized protein